MNRKNTSDEDEGRKVRGEIDLDDLFLSPSHATKRAAVLMKLVAKAKSVIANADPGSEESREADRRIRGAIRVLATGSSELKQPEKLRALGRALELAPRILDGDADDFYWLDRLENDAEEAGVDRSVLLNALGEERRTKILISHVRSILAELLEDDELSTKKKLSEEIIREAVRCWPKHARGRTKALMAVAKVIGVTRSNPETFRTEFAKAKK